MNATALSSNRHPVDQLALVREEIKTLKEREEELRAIVSAEMGAADTLGGDEFIARQTMSKRKGGIDEAKLKKAGIDIDTYRKPDTAVLSIRIERRAMEEAA